MLFLLKNGGITKVKDIAEKLEVSEKQVKRYKEELEQYFDIESIPGPSGGYRLSDMYFPFKAVLSEDEMELLKYAVGQLDDMSQLNNSRLKAAINKINYSILNQSQHEDDYIISYARNIEVDKEFLNMINDMYKAILNDLEIEIIYEDNRHNESKRCIQPYKFIRYKGEKYLVANCLLRNDIRYFKVKRIKRYEVTSNRFKRSIDINKILEKHKSERFGIYEGRTFNIELHIYPPMAMSIKEKIWIENQEIKEYKDGSINFKAEAQESPELITWILGMGDNVKVIGSEEIKLIIKNKLEKMINNFN